MNNIVIVGRLTREVELRYIAGSGMPVATFTVAVDRDFVGQDGKRGVDFIDCQTWNKQAENCANYLGKGSLVSVQGALRIESYQTKEGENRRSCRINANRVNFLSTNKPNQEKQQSTPTFEPSFEPTGLNPSEWSAIDDGDLPF